MHIFVTKIHYFFYTWKKPSIMQIFRVGGAVRDKLLGLPVKDNDWVVVGATPEKMKSLGYQSVGKDFPVFLNPDTKEEYALARTERKTGRGYAGFNFYTSSDISLEEDLLRRDLTINAMAEDRSGVIIDPYGGLDDLKNRKLRHVSPAFKEDPLRILRVARFTAKLAPLGFHVAKETLELMKAIVNSGEASYLVPERVWQETLSALMEPSPSAYFHTLESCGALQVVLPGLRPFIHSQSLSHLNFSAQANSPALVRFGCLLAPHSSQSITEKNKDIDNIQKVASELRLPSEFFNMALLVIKYSGDVTSSCCNPNAESLMSLFEATDALRRPERFITLLEIQSFCSNNIEIKTRLLTELLYGCLKIKAGDIVSKNIKGKMVGEALRNKRILWIDSKLQ